MHKYLAIIFLSLTCTVWGQETHPTIKPVESMAPSNSDSGAITKDFDTWLKEFEKRALSEGITEHTLKKAKKHFVFDPKIIALDRKQPEGMLDFDTYYAARVPPRLTEAKKLYEEHRALLSSVQKKYNVPASVMLALWGMETNFGKLKGKYLVLGSLATLAYEGRRAEYFTKELLNALKILQTYKIKHTEFKGSWAGAMGHCQFMPTTYLMHATNGETGQMADIWNSLDHVFSSMANYLHNIGWKIEEPILIPVQLPADFDETIIAEKHKKTWKDWKALNIEHLGDQKVEETIIGYLQRAPLTDKVFLVFNNYEMLLQWNRSNNFAISVGLFANRLEE